jgi:CRP-like cAMP-binding protein
VTETDLDRVSLLLGTYLFGDLSPAELEPLARATTIRDLVRSERVFNVGDPADAIYVVVSGQLKDTLTTADGDEVVFAVYGPGMIVGEPGFFAPERDRVMAVAALGPTRLLVLAREHLWAFLQQHPQVLVRALESVSTAARRSTDIITALSRLPLGERLFLRLLDLAETYRDAATGERFTPKISQSTLAAMVGASRENVNRALAALAAAGAIRIEKGRYAVRDPEGVVESHPWPLGAERRTEADPPDV